MSENAWLCWGIDTLIASSLLMAAVLLVRGHVRRLFGAQVAYALWALPLLRLILPPIPAAWREAAATPVTRATETIAAVVSSADVVVAPLPVGAAAAAEPLVTLPSVGQAIALLWILGAVGFVLWHGFNHRRFCRAILSDARRLGERDGVHVVASDAARGPVAFGVIERYVAFPLDFADRWDEDERALALDHELGHHARGDLVANWVALVVLALHWFNPLAWRAFRTFRADQELANDARVLAGRSRTDRHIYACAIVKAAHGGAVSAACHLHTISDLKGRLRLLTTSRTSRRRLVAGTFSVGVLLVAGLGATASGTHAAEAVGAQVGTAITRSSALAPIARIAPVAPMAPVAPAAPVPPLSALALASAAPLAPPAPSAPPAPPAPGVPAGGSGVTRTTEIVNGHRITTVRIDEDMIRDVRRRASEQAAAAPTVSNRQCGDSVPAATMTVRRGRAIIVCTDHINQAVQRAEAARRTTTTISRNGSMSVPGLSVSSSGAISMPGISISSAGAISAPGVSVSTSGAVAATGVSISSGGDIAGSGNVRANMEQAIARLRKTRALLEDTRIPDWARDSAQGSIDRSIAQIDQHIARLN